MAHITHDITPATFMGETIVKVDYTLINYQLGSSTATVLVRGLNASGDKVIEKTVVLENENVLANLGQTIANNLTASLNFTKA